MLIPFWNKFDNEKFYETAAPRVSLFVNTATEKGAKALFGDTIPTELKDLHNGQRTKVQYAFVRVHTYFYNSEIGQYQLPDGFNDKIWVWININRLIICSMMSYLKNILVFLKIFCDFLGYYKFSAIKILQIQI